MYLFEIHLTVNELTDDKISNFENLCQDLGGKAILIELPMGEHTQQPMMTYVKKATDIGEILADIDTLKPKFLNQDFKIIRTKIEIPADQHDAYIKEFPDTNGYFEWHGKVEFLLPKMLNYCLQTLREYSEYGGYHLSKNALKNNKNQRFINYRSNDYQQFIQKIEGIRSIENHYLMSDTGKMFLLKIIKEQAEYCVYDDKLSLDNGWDGNFDFKSNPLLFYHNYYPNLVGYYGSDYDYLDELCIYEGIIRRSAKVNKNMMLKGSFVTRQYFDNPNDRMPLDLDFVCLTPLDNLDTANQVLNDWLSAVTRYNANDGIYFVDFAENAFWRKIDYAMHDDFPTVTGEIVCHMNGKTYEIYVEVSFNLPIPFEPVPLLLKTPIDEFIYPKTVSLSLQIAWKIHQTIVRPRLKDIYDLTYLVKRVDNQKMIDDVIFALLQECEKDKISIEKVKEFFKYHWQSLKFEKYDDELGKDFFPLFLDSAELLFKQFKENMQQAGFVLENLTLNYDKFQDKVTEAPKQNNETYNQEPSQSLWQKISRVFK